MNKNRTAILSNVLNGLMSRYQQRVPDVNKIIQAMVDEHLIDCGASIENDHIAFRSMGVPGLGVPSLEKIFLYYGYKKMDYYYFAAKKLDAWWFAPPDPTFPRIFASHLRVSEMSEGARQVIHSYTDEWQGADPVDGLDLDDAEAVDQFLHKGLWRTPTLADYESLLAESEYAAWVIFNHYYLNHFTISIQNLPQGYNTIATFNEFLENRGFVLNTAGGKIKVSQDGKLLQSSTMAGLNPVVFADGKVKDIPGSYVEFAERKPLDAFMHLPKEQLKRMHYRDGFETANADRIFESTYIHPGKGPQDSRE